MKPEETKTDIKNTGVGVNIDGLWQDVEQKVLDPAVLKNEFPENHFDSMTVEKTRRSFLKIMGYSVSALPLTGCIKIPVRKALPYLNKVDNTIPGVPNYYASTFEGVPLLVKTREGRPIKVEGNPQSITTLGGTDAKAQASVLSLYDSNRYRSALIEGKSVEWKEFDKNLKERLAKVQGEIAVVTPSLRSPSEIAIVNKFKQKFQKYFRQNYKSL